jgi:hypothetical protein
MIRSLGASASLAGLAVAATLVGCSATSPYMHPVVGPSMVAPPEGEAAVVFLRRATACDYGSWFLVIDEHGHYVGDSMPGSTFAVTYPAGDHAFFAWDPDAELDVERYPYLNQVGAVRAQLDAGRTYVVTVGTQQSPFGERGRTCSPYPWVHLKLVPLESVSGVLSETKTFVPDRAAGEAVIARDRALIERHVGMGMAKLVADPRTPPPAPPATP